MGFTCLIHSSRACKPSAFTKQGVRVMAGGVFANERQHGGVH